MTQKEMIDNLFLNHHVTLMKNLASFERGKSQSYFRDEAVNAVLNELEHLPLSEHIVLKAFERLDLALYMEKQFIKSNKKLKNMQARAIKKAQERHEQENWCMFVPA